MKNIPYLLALHSIDGLGPIRLKAILDYFKDPKLAWEADGKKFKEIGIPTSVVEQLLETRKRLEPEKLLEDLEKDGIKWMTIFDEDYPQLLKQIYDPPIILYYKGEFAPEDNRAIAIVGTRKMTGYGKLVTEKFAAELATSALTIVSGLARGIDSTAHQAALEASGRTIAVLGGGLNKVYPPENKKLVEKIIGGRGVVFSEFPPNYPALSGNFPSRNRIISGLSLAVLVTEAAQDSGSLITARLALEQGRDVFAVPGPITSSFSRGPVNLIREGARIIFEASEILEELGLDQVQSSKFKVFAPSSGLGVQSELKLADEEKKILECLDKDNKHIDEICRELQLDAATTSASLLKMEIHGIVRNLGSGIYCKNSAVSY